MVSGQGHLLPQDVFARPPCGSLAHGVIAPLRIAVQSFKAQHS